MKAEFERLPAALKGFIRDIGHFADGQGAVLYLVGGSVRDMILAQGHMDLDFVVEGDGVGFAASLAQKKRAKVIVHRRFGTATVWFPEGYKVDFASARREVYEKPGALPLVTAGTIHDDLFRRDFTINAMAMCLNFSRFGELVDDFGGQKDLRAGLIRVLHSLSFFDDPTRILRAIRFEQRLGFVLEKGTLAVLREALQCGVLHRVQKHRLKDEMVLIFKEQDPFPALDRLGRLAGFSFITPALRRVSSWRWEFTEVRRALEAFRLRHPKKHLEPYRMALALFFARISFKKAKAVMHDFAFHRTESAGVLSLMNCFPAAKRELRRRSVGASAVFRVLFPLSLEMVLLLPVLLRSGEVKRRVGIYVEWSSLQRLHVKGEDLLALGLKPGPRYKEILRDLLSAKIDKEVKTREDEIAWVKRFAMKG
jgi:tRNA nucleotidyltransferase (CCA-adding enzyme)